jgi:hypothetical protein
LNLLYVINISFSCLVRRLSIPVLLFVHNRRVLAVPILRKAFFHVRKPRLTSLLHL